MALDNSVPLNSLGFAKPPSETRVVVAMSGGVTALWLLRNWHQRVMMWLA